MRGSILVLGFLIGFATHSQSFVKVLGQPGRVEGGFVSHATASGDVYIGGQVNDSAVVHRIDQNGEIIWSVSFKPPGQFPKNVIHLSTSQDGSVIGCGSGNNTIAEPVEGFHFRISTMGTVMWIRHWEDPNILERRIYALNANEYIIFGGYFSNSGPNWTDAITARVNALTGELIWISDRLEQYATVPYINDMGAVATIGAVHYAASSLFTNGSPLSTRRVGLSRFTFDGQHLDTRYLLYSNSVSARLVTSDIVATSDSLTIAFHGDVNGASTNFTHGLLRTDTLGNIAWAVNFDIMGSVREHSTNLVVTDFGYLIAGQTDLTEPKRLFLTAVSRTGVHLWTRTYGPPDQDQSLSHLHGFNLTTVPDGFLFTGAVDQGNGDKDLLIIRTDSNGSVQCSTVGTLTVTVTQLPTLSFVCSSEDQPLLTGLAATPSVATNVAMWDPCRTLFSLGNDTIVCSPIILDATQPSASYMWQNGVTQSTFTASSSGTYWVTVSLNCCVFTDSIEITFGTQSEAMQSVSICKDQSTTLEPPYATTAIVWSTGDSTTQITVTEGEYSYIATDLAGCVHMDTVRVVLGSIAADPERVPNVFSPNGDGVNDQFLPVATTAKLLEHTVYNRWGQVVWSVSYPGAAWDGTLQGLPVPDGTYFYLVKYRDDCSPDQGVQVARGHVTLLR